MNKLNIFKMVIMALFVFLPMSANAGGGPGNISPSAPSTPVLTDAVSMQLISYYDLRNRESFVQVSNVSNVGVSIHVQIFQNDLIGCPELNFYDTLTPNDTHIYNMNDLVGNALPVNIDIGDDSNGFVVITQVEAATPGSDAVEFEDASLIGNFRIVDATGYEYRTNSGGFPDISQLVSAIDGERRDNARFTTNFNQIGGNNQSDVVGITILNAGPNFPSVNDISSTFETFVFNNAEFPTSCDTVTFGCGGGFFGELANTAETDLLNQGINDVFPSTNGDNLICSGNQDTEGFVDFITNEFTFRGAFRFFVGYTGLNNGDGTGSMDSWIGNPINICRFFPDGDCPLSIEGIRGPG